MDTKGAYTHMDGAKQIEIAVSCKVLVGVNFTVTEEIFCAIEDQSALEWLDLMEMVIKPFMAAESKIFNMPKKTWWLYLRGKIVADSNHPDVDPKPLFLWEYSNVIEITNVSTLS
jgi:hypothetical protein